MRQNWKKVAVPSVKTCMGPIESLDCFGKLDQEWPPTPPTPQLPHSPTPQLPNSPTPPLPNSPTPQLPNSQAELPTLLEKKYMKTGFRYLSIVALAIAALTWTSLNVISQEEEQQTGLAEDPAGRDVFRRLQLQDANGQIPPNALREAYEYKKGMEFLPEAWEEFQQREDPDVPGWIAIGPGNIGGRVRSLVIHPTNPATMWVGAVAGGVWKTTNGGGSWSTNTDFLANLAVSCLAIDPANPNVLYAGTGEGFYNHDGVQGYGIFKTTDGGNTWVQLPSTNHPDFYWVNRLAISPTNSQHLLAATRSPGKILRSTDGGGSWSTRLVAPTTMDDVRFKPNTESDGSEGFEVPDVFAIQCVAGSFRGHVYYSRNDGVDWSLASGLPTPVDFQRVELAYSRSNPLIVYASVAFEGGQLFRSTNGGLSFVQMGGPVGGTSASWYANTVWVDPINPDRVLVGGYPNLWRTTQGGAGGWTQANNIHPDHHAIVSHPGYNGGTNTTVYVGNDGGVYQTTSVLATPLTWTPLNNNLAITQFYGGAGNVATGRIIGGTQDNGTVRYLNNPQTPNWTTMFGGDGGFCAADQTDPNYFYGEYISLRIFRSTDGGTSATYIWPGIPANCGDGPCANFTAPFILDPNNPNTLLAGGKSLWRSTNAKASQPTWTEIKEPAGSTFNYVGAIAVAPNQPNIIWVGYNDGSVYRTANGTAANPTWTQADSQLPHGGHFCTRITIAPPALEGPPAGGTEDPQVGFTVYVTFGGFNNDNVWKTQNNGLSWTNIHNNLPIAPIRSLVVSPSDPNKLYVGTEVGVFAGVTVNGVTTWSPGSGSVDGPAHTRVDELFWMGSKLVVATHGRSMFTLGN